MEKDELWRTYGKGRVVADIWKRTSCGGHMEKDELWRT